MQILDGGVWESNYNEENRGKVQYESRAKQYIRFERLRYGNITPTDIDGYMEYHDAGFVFYEAKYENAKMSPGQEKSYTRLCDALQSAGKVAILMLCEHDTQADNDVWLYSCVVREYYYKKKWHSGNNRTVLQLTDLIIEKLDEWERIYKC